MKYARLILLGEDGENPPESMQRVWLLTQERTTIGRSRSADLTMDSEAYPCTLSRTHVVIWRRKSEEGPQSYNWLVTDCHSLNGTFIECVKVHESEIHDGETLTLGGGAGLQPGERSDLLASDLVFRFETLSDSEAKRAGIPMSEDEASESEETTAEDGSKSVGREVSSASESAAPVEKSDTDSDAKVDNQAVSSPSKAPPSQKSSAVQQPSTPAHGGETDSNKRRQENDSRTSDRQKKRRRITMQKSSSASASVGSPAAADTQSSASLRASQELKCAICCDYFLSASTLMCAHSFCESCIEEWLHKKHECPVCRAKVTSRPVRSTVLDNLVQTMIPASALQEWSKRRTRYKARRQREEHSLLSLKRRLQNAKNDNNELLNITEEWSAEQKAVFEQGVNQYRGDARIQYCQATGLTKQFVENGSLHMLLRAAINVGIINDAFISIANDPSSEIPEAIKNADIRRRLHMFIWYG